MDAWDKFLENSIAEDRQRKKESREHEIWILENSDKIPDGVVQDAMEDERGYRKILDDEIKRQQKWLMDRKES